VNARAGLFALAAGLLLAGLAAGPRAQPAPGQASVPATPADRDASTLALSVQGPVRLFFDACVRPEADTAGAVDAALAAGWDPADGADPAVAALLAGEGGQVFVSPGASSRAWLAVTPRGRCTVWIERASGPAVRHAFLQAAGELQAREGRSTVAVDRALERAGAWRQHLVLRYRRAGGDRDHALGLVSTLGDGLGAQALQLAPAAALPGGNGPAREPDGQAVR